MYLVLNLSGGGRLKEGGREGGRLDMISQKVVYSTVYSLEENICIEFARIIWSIVLSLLN